jgi:hypothetical protein
MVTKRDDFPKKLWKNPASHLMNVGTDDWALDDLIEKKRANDGQVR